MGKISHDRYFIKYSPNLNTITGGLKSTILFERLEYWAQKKPNGFYKFFEPCAHYLCKKGDTLLEETGLTRRVINAAFELFGIRYKSKAEFLQAEDKFQGKWYASYYDRKSNLTYYLRNHELVSQTFKKCKQANKPTSTKKKSKSKKENGTTSKSINVSQHPGCSSNDDIGRSFIDKQDNTNITPYTPQTNETDSAKEGINKIIKIWQDYLPTDIHLSNISSSTKRSLSALIKTKLDNSLDKWRNMCREISNNDFLLGITSTNGWKVSLDWLTKPENFEKILQGSYGVNPDKIMQVAPNETDLARKIDREEANSKIANLKKLILQRAGAASYKSWFDIVIFSWLETESRFIISSVTNFWKSYVENNFRWLCELGAPIEIKV